MINEDCGCGHKEKPTHMAPKKKHVKALLIKLMNERINKVDGKYVVYPKKGGDRLGTHDTKKSALKQLALFELNLDESYVLGVSDIDVIAATIVGEAGGEGYKGMQAIKNVLQNRADKKGTIPAREALRPKQFSMWDDATKGVSVPGDFNEKNRPVKIQKIIDMYKKHSKWDTAVTLSKNKIKDITGGATSYYASGGTQEIDPPYWAKDWKAPMIIGNHTFGN